jgi:hypothetical protein
MEIANMITIQLNADGSILGIADKETAKNFKLWQQNLLQDHNDWKSFMRVEEIAAKLTELTGTAYQATDAGEYVYPRYDVQQKPQVGDEISYSFNGDTYPDGTIVRISKTGNVVTSSSGKTYRRRKLTGAYTNHGWFMVHGHISEKNPHF